MKKFLSPIIFWLCLLAGHSVVAGPVCFDGASGFNKHVNVIEICLVDKASALVKMYYFNNIYDMPKTTCEAKVGYKSKEKGFELMPANGVCPHGRDFLSPNLACDMIVDDVYRCNIKDVNADIIISKARIIN